MTKKQSKSPLNSVKRNIFNDTLLQAVLGVSLFIVGTLLGVLIAQRQSLTDGPIAPNAPESQPSAAETSPATCELVFDVRESTPDNHVSCQKQFSAETITLGETGTFTIELNDSPQNLSLNEDVIIRDILPTGFEFNRFVQPSQDPGIDTVTAEGVSCNNATNTIECRFSNITEQSSVTIEYLTADVINAETVENTATIDYLEPNYTSCSDSITIAHNNTTLPTPEPTTCTNCNYQIDAYWGPVIKNFYDGNQRHRYSSSGPNGSSRLLRSRSSRSISTGYSSCQLGQITPNDGPTNVTSFPCDAVNPQTYLSAYIDTSNVHSDNGGYATATFINDSQNCAIEIGLASYRADDTLSSPANIDSQEYITHTSTVIQPNTEIMLTVPMAMLGENESSCTDTVNSDGATNQTNSFSSQESGGFGGYNSALEFLRSFFDN